MTLGAGRAWRHHLAYLGDIVSNAIGHDLALELAVAISGAAFASADLTSDMPYELLEFTQDDAGFPQPRDGGPMVRRRSLRRLPAARTASGEAGGDAAGVLRTDAGGAAASSLDPAGDPSWGYLMVARISSTKSIVVFGWRKAKRAMVSPCHAVGVTKPTWAASSWRDHRW